MVNYKNVFVNTFTFQGVARTKAITDKIIILYFDIALGGVEKSLFDSATALVYQVPTGKTFKILGILIESAATTTSKIYQGDSQDAITTLKQNFTPTNVAGLFTYAVNIDIAADKYVSYDPIATNKIYYIQAIGVEV